MLTRDLEHEIYMKIPEVYDEVISKDVDKEDCLILQKAIYGLVQALRPFWKKIVDKMQGGGFQLSEADPCMLYIEDEKWVCIIIIYIDDMLIIGNNQRYMGNIIVIPVSYLGTLLQELRNLREWDTVWTMGRRHGKMSHR